MSIDFESFLTVAWTSSLGLVRNVNEDACGELTHEGVFWVADGMGGGSAGEIASNIICDEIASVSAEMNHDDSPGLRKYNLQQALFASHKKIRKLAEANHFRQMGSTVAMLMMDPWNPRNAWLCHVGDSRIYRFRNGTTVPLTRDHTLGEELASAAKNEADRATFKDHRMNRLSHILTQAIGVSSSVKPEWNTVDVAPRDRFLICSDGVSTMLTELEIWHILAHEVEPEAMLQELSVAVNQAGAKDNFTAVAVFVQENLPEQEIHDDDEEKENQYLLKIAEERNDHA